MRKLFILNVLILCFLSSGCMVSEAEFNKAKSETADLRKKISEQENKFSEIQNEVAELKTKISERDLEISKLEKDLEVTSEKLSLYKNETIEASESSSLSENSSVEDEYIANFIDVYDINAKYFSSILDGKVPGIEFKIKNKGIKTVVDIKIVFFFKDSKDKIIFEDYFRPLAGGYSEPRTILKPNYIWKMETGKFYPVKKCPEEWKEGKVSYKIEEIKFE